MLQSPETDTEKKKAFDLREIAFVLLARWRIVAITTGVFFLWTLIQLHMSASVFAVQMVVTQVQGTGGQTASRVSSLSSLAQLAGLNLGPSAGQSASQFRYYIDSIYSRELADELAKDKDLMLSIFGREWDSKTQSWKKPSPSVVERIKGGIYWLLGSRPLPWTPPDGARLQEYLAEPGNLSVIEDIKRPDHATIEVDTSDPKFGIKLLNAVNWNANELLRKRALRRATQYINYLTGELNTVTVAEHREAIMQALSEQEKFKMSASSGAPYAADMFDKPWVSRKRMSPRPSKAYPAALLKGILLGAIIALVIEYYGEAIRQRIRRWAPVEKLPPRVRQYIDP